MVTPSLDSWVRSTNPGPPKQAVAAFSDVELGQSVKTARSKPNKKKPHQQASSASANKQSKKKQ
jgi:hypothetical protein